MASTPSLLFPYCLVRRSGWPLSRRNELLLAQRILSAPLNPSIAAVWLMRGRDTSFGRDYFEDGTGFESLTTFSTACLSSSSL